MKILSIDPKNFNTEEVNLIVDALNHGQVLILPTDTVYGLVARSDNKEAVEKIFAIKKRVIDKPLPVFISSIEMAKEIAVVDKKNEELLQERWPGKFTFILNRNNKYKKNIFGANIDTIALRIPDFKLLNDVLEKIDTPLSQTSANISGDPASGDINQIISDFEKENIKPDLIINCGKKNETRPSIIIDLVSGEILRS